MDRDTIEKLLRTQPQEIQAHGAMLYNAMVECGTAYRESHTAANLRNWQAAQDALDKFIAKIGAVDQERPLLTMADVLEYLSNDWKVTQTTLYRHHKHGKLIPQPDGTFRIKDVEKYARTFLKQKSTGKLLNEKLDELQRKKEELEVETLEIRKKRETLALGKEENRFIPREQLELDISSRSGHLKSVLNYWIQSCAAEWVQTVEGDTRRVGELINLMLKDLQKHINSFFATREEKETIYDGPEEEETEKFIP